MRMWLILNMCVCEPYQVPSIICIHGGFSLVIATLMELLIIYYICIYADIYNVELYRLHSRINFSLSPSRIYM